MKRKLNCVHDFCLFSRLYFSLYIFGFLLHVFWVVLFVLEQNREIVLKTFILIISCVVKLWWLGSIFLVGNWNYFLCWSRMNRAIWVWTSETKYNHVNENVMCSLWTRIKFKIRNEIPITIIDVTTTWVVLTISIHFHVNYSCDRYRFDNNKTIITDYLLKLVTYFFR